MNRYLLVIFMAVAAVFHAKAQEPADTALYVLNPEKVIVTESPDALSVQVLDEAGSPVESYRFPYEEGKAVRSRTFNTLPLSDEWSGRYGRFDLTMGGLGLGFINACGAPSGSGMEMGKSLEFTIRHALAFMWELPNKHDSFLAGIGMTWRNYKMSADTRFFLDPAAGQVGIGGYAEGLNPQGSRLKTFSLSFPVSWRHRIGKYQSVELSVIMNANTYGSLKTTYTTGSGIKSEEFCKVSSLVRRFTVDFSASVQVCHAVGLYVRYSPMKVLKTGAGPDFTPFSTGILLAY